MRSCACTFVHVKLCISFAPILPECVNFATAGSEALTLHQLENHHFASTNSHTPLLEGVKRGGLLSKYKVATKYSRQGRVSFAQPKQPSACILAASNHSFLISSL